MQSSAAQQDVTFVWIRLSVTSFHASLARTLRWTSYIFYCFRFVTRSPAELAECCVFFAICTWTLLWCWSTVGTWLDYKVFWWSYYSLRSSRQREALCWYEFLPESTFAKLNFGVVCCLFDCSYTSCLKAHTKALVWLSAEVQLWGPCFLYRLGPYHEIFLEWCLSNIRATFCRLSVAADDRISMWL